MLLLELFAGVTGQIIKLAFIAPIAVIMWWLSRQLYTKRKRKAYKDLSFISLGFLIFISIGFIFTIVAEWVNFETQWLINSINAAFNSAWILFLSGFHRIRHEVGLKTYLAFYIPALLTMIVGFSSITVSCVIAIIFSLILTFFQKINIGHERNAWIAGGIFSFTMVCMIMADLIPSTAGAAYLASAFVLPAAYTVLLLSLMDHSLLIMQSSYVSAITDPLTGLFNRRYFTTYITKCIERNIPVHVIFFDIDNFKKLNDTQGHKKGDEILKQVASIIMEEIEGIGIAGRYGGEEMVALVQNVDVDMSELTERIRSRIEQESIVTSSIGYRIFETGLAPEALIKQADEAMYIAKTTGKNKVVRYGA
jgi:diguanylate cyclase (GGDEF)-like protein